MNSLRENPPPESPVLGGSRVLVVEDDQVSRSLLQFALAKKGYDVAVAEDAADAREQLPPDRIGFFECVVTDYRMPESSGLDLLDWIRSQDPSLATIIITAESEKQLVTRSFLSGAVDFIDKPIDLEKLHTAVARAIQRTRRDRRLAESETDLRNLGRAQAWMLGAHAAGHPVCADVFFHPRHEAGGDFFSRFHPTPDRSFFLLTDVSGHDPQAGYISAYFHGNVRGMLLRGAPLDEIFADFNRFLLEEWNRDDALSSQLGINTSIGVCAIAIDNRARNATVMTHGMPAPVYWLPDGDALAVGQTGGFPLGWFRDFAVNDAIQSMSGGGSFCFWTDGLEEAAAKAGVSELSLAWALQRAKLRDQTLAEIGRTADDILLADIYLGPNQPAASFRPLILEQYHGDQSGEIDNLQAFWRRSLALAAAELPDSMLHDILLAAREALLNALQHGCRGQAGREVNFQIAYSPSLRTIRVRVSDPGSGHRFNVDEQESRAARELTEKHRGLILIRHLAAKMTFGRNGASLTMDFITGCHCKSLTPQQESV